MTKFAIFPTQAAALAFVAQIDADYGFPNADAKTYAVPTKNADGTWTVRIKDWLRISVASVKWTRSAAQARVQALNLSGKLLDVAPEPKDKPVEAASNVEAAEVKVI